MEAVTLGAMTDSTSEMGVTGGTELTELKGKFGKSILFEIEIDLILYLDPIIAIVGLLGNLFSFIAFGRPSLRGKPLSVFFRTLAVFDSLILITMLLENKYLDSLENSRITCTLVYWAMPVSFFVSGWTVLAVSIERLFVVMWPLYAKSWCTQRTARVTVSVLVLGFGSLWAAVVGIYGGPWTGGCNNSGFLAFMADYGFMLTLSVHTLIPTPSILILNVALAIHLLKVRATRATLGVAAKEENESTKNVTRATKTTMLVSITYLVLTLPIAAYNITATFYGFERSVPTFFAGSQGLRLRYVNHSINFLLYLVGMPKVRAEMKQMFQRVHCNPGHCNQLPSSQECSATKETASSSVQTLSATEHGQEHK